MDQGKPGYINQQKGSVTLIVSFILIIAIGLITLIGSRSSLYDIKIQTNEYHYKVAFEAAQYGLQQGIAYLTQNYPMVPTSSNTAGWMYGTPKWSACSGTDTTVPCGDGTTAVYGSTMLAYKNVPNLIAPSKSGVNLSVHFLTKSNSGSPYTKPLVKVIAVVTANSGRAQSIVTQEVKGKDLFFNVAPTPLSATGNVALTGNFNAWGNTIDGSVFSIWSGQAVMPLSGSASTYDITQSSGQYPNKTAILSHDTVNTGDIVENDPDFPTDLFYYLFGVPKSQYSKVMENSSVYANCNSVNSSTTGLIWITGDCSLSNSNGSQIGSSSLPVMLIVSGQLKVSGNMHLYGGVYIRDVSSGVDITGTIDIHGIIAVDRSLDLGSGTVNVNYDADVISNLNSAGGTFVYVPGSWNDALSQ